MSPNHLREDDIETVEEIMRNEAHDEQHSLQEMTVQELASITGGGYPVIVGEPGDGGYPPLSDLLAGLSFGSPVRPPRSARTLI